MTAPLIVTARLADACFAALDGMRRRHFPAHLNKVPAHVSLFHHLPGEEAEAILATVSQACAGLDPLDLQPAGVRFLGRGVALAYSSADLARLHAHLAATWRPWLTPQDRQPFKAHVTIQNKVKPAIARALAADLASAPQPPGRIDGIVVWRYLGGPWQHVATYRFPPDQRFKLPCPPLPSSSVSG